MSRRAAVNPPSAPRADHQLPSRTDPLFPQREVPGHARWRRRAGWTFRSRATRTGSRRPRGCPSKLPKPLDDAVRATPLPAPRRGATPHRAHRCLLVLQHHPVHHRCRTAGARVINAVQEIRAKRKLDRLLLLDRSTVTVVRDGVDVEVTPDHRRTTPMPSPMPSPESSATRRSRPGPTSDFGGNTTAVAAGATSSSSGSPPATGTRSASGWSPGTGSSSPSSPWFSPGPTSGSATSPSADREPDRPHVSDERPEKRVFGRMDDTSSCAVWQKDDTAPRLRFRRVRG
jgi:hypothetical protein